MKHLATIEVHLHEDGLVYAEIRAVPDFGALLTGRFATCDALLNAIAPAIAELRKDASAPRKLIAGACPSGEVP